VRGRHALRGRRGAGSKGSSVAYMGGGVDSASMKGVRGTHQARGSVPQLTEAVGYRRGGRVGDGWWMAHEGWWRSDVVPVGQ
jgi:hypothetical protein